MLHERTNGSTSAWFSRVLFGKQARRLVDGLKIVQHACQRARLSGKAQLLVHSRNLQVMGCFGSKKEAE